ncbi:MAG TPA: hypothetical protein VK620_00405 [Bradyrhizobium sp.]|jgi:hypothetical protein|nr:hypothetical protein [Bradyrhizobium sp.]
MAALKSLPLSDDELAVLRNLGKVILANYNNEEVCTPEPSAAEFKTLAGIFSRVMSFAAMVDNPELVQEREIPLLLF